jgi:hypothetical protein
LRKKSKLFPQKKISIGFNISSIRLIKKAYKFISFYYN